MLLSTVTVTIPQDVVDVDLTTITVSRLANLAHNPDGQISLREAIHAARNTSAADTINLPANTYILGGTQLRYDAAAAGNTLTLQAAGAAGSAIIDAAGNSRLLEISGLGAVNLVGLRLQNGGSVDRGGGIFNAGTLTLTNCTLADNKAVGADGANSTEQFVNGGPGGDAFGGGIYSSGSLTLQGTTLSGNRAKGGHGGTTVPASGTIGGRGGDAFGGSIYSTGALTASGSVFNTSAAIGGHGGTGGHFVNDDAAGGDASGGGVLNASTTPATFTDCTFSGNAVSPGGGGRGFSVEHARVGNPAGGGFFNAANATATLNGCTFSGNSVSGEFLREDTDGDGEEGPYYYYPSADARGGGIYNAGTISAARLTVGNNSATGGGGASSDAEGTRGGAGYGGGVFNDLAASLTLFQSTITSNAAIGGPGGQGLFSHYLGILGDGAGGGIYNLHAVSLNAVTVSDNSASERGGGIANADMLSATTVAVTGNTVAGQVLDAASQTRQPLAVRGGGIDNTGTLTLVGSTLSDNRAIGTDGDAGESPFTAGSPGGDALGGALYNGSSARIINTTIANNSVVGGDGGNDAPGAEEEDTAVGGDGTGGAIANDGGTLWLTQCTISGNAAAAGAGADGAAAGHAFGGGIETSGGGASVRLDNTIVAGNTATSGGPDVRGNFVSGPVGTGGANLIGNVGLASGFVAGVDIIGGNGQPVIDARLGALADNGGATQTIALLAGSPAFGTGRNGLALDANNAALATDQRGNGFARIVGAAVDIGAFEDQRTTASIAGTFFYDRNHNGLRDTDDPGLPGWTVYADINDNGVRDAGEPSAVTTADGSYVIAGLAAGRYSRVREVRPDGWTRTLPAGVFPQGYYDVTLSPDQLAGGRDFGNFKDAPAAPSAADDAFTTPHDTAVILNVLANDVADIGFDPATVTIIVPPAHGSATLDTATGRITYTPSTGFVGDDSFTYTVKNIEGTATNPATVGITVDPPVTLGVTISGALPAEVVGGIRTKPLKQTLTLTNLTDQRVQGPLTLTVYSSDDRTHFHPEDAMAVVELKRLRLAPQASKRFNVRIDSGDLASGASHWLIGEARGDAGYSAPAWTESTIAVAAPFVDLTGTFVEPLPDAMRPGRKAIVRLTLENLGNVRLRDAVDVSLTTTNAGAPTPLASPTLKVKLNPGQSRQYKVRFAVPADLPTGPALIAALVDAGNVVAESDEANNTFSATAGVQ